MNCLETALFFAKLGKSVIPVGSGKTPLVAWKKFQKRIASVEEILEWWKKYPNANVGMVTGSISDVVVVDTDTPEATQRVREMMGDSIFPVQKTPRGGRHFFFKYEPGFINRAAVKDGIDIRTDGGYVMLTPSKSAKGGWEWENEQWGEALFSILCEMPSQITHFLKSGIQADTNIKNINSYSYIGVNDSENLPPEDQMVLESKEVNPESQQVNLSQNESNSFGEGKRNDSVFHVAFKLRKSRTDESIIRDTIKAIASYCGLPEREAYRTMESAIARADSGQPEERNISSELRKWVSESTGVNFIVKDWYNESNLVKIEDKHTSIVVLANLCKEGIIERIGQRRGEYRIVDKSMEYVDFKNSNFDEKIDLWLPLDIQKKTVFFPKNVIVVAGVQGYGKTTFLFNIIKENMNNFPFVYFASEMAPQTIKYKLSFFGIPVENWNMKVVPDHVWDFNNISDKIHPDSINVIDYLEADAEKTFNIHNAITKCLKKLEKGMLIIALQKNKGQELASGGSYTSRAASLYLSIDWNTILIVKNRFMEMDPARSCKRRNFIIRHNQQYEATSKWFDPNIEQKEEREIPKDYYGGD